MANVINSCTAVHGAAHVVVGGKNIATLGHKAPLRISAQNAPTLHSTKLTVHIFDVF